MRKINRPDCPNPTALATNYKHDDNKQALITASHGKCMYCESKVTHVYFGDVEHIKPKTKYPTLEFEWTNLGFVCAKCNNAKSDRFDEATPYVNPYEEEPKDHLIALGAMLMHKNGSERGELTTTDIELNRPDLVEKRQEKLNNIQKWIDAAMRTQNETLKKAAITELLNEADEDKEYSLFVVNFLKLHELA